MSNKLKELVGSYYINHGLGPLNPPTCTGGATVQNPKQKEVENTMCTRKVSQDLSLNITAPIAATSDESKKRDYLKSRLVDVLEGQNDKLRDLFRTSTPKGPKNAAELIERIKKGEYTYNEKKDTHSWFGDMFDSYYGAISWRTKPADEEGFEKAFAELSKEYTKAKDVIAIADPADGLKSLQALEAWTTSVKPN